MPAGTGVCVVNTVPARTACSASSKVSPSFSTSSRIRSTPRKPAWPSLVWNTSGAGAPVDGAVGADRAHAADAEQQLLLQAVLAPAAVEPVGDLPRGGVVLLDVAVEQQQRHPADVGHPHLGVQRAALGQGDHDPHRRAVRVLERMQRQAARVEGRVVLELPAVGRQRLPEVAGAVEQADADDRDAEVARRLEVVAGEDAEAAGVLRQHLGDAELRREVADRAAGQRVSPLGLLLLVPARLGEVVGQVVVHIGKPTQELAIACQRVDAFGAELAEHPARIAAARAPQVRVDRLEQVERIGMPRPAQVVDEFGQFVQLCGKRGAHGQPP